MRFAPLLIVPLLLACGGGGGGGGTTPSLTIYSAAELDGTAYSSGNVVFSPSAAFMFTGDLEESYFPGYMGRQLYAFNVGGLPAGAGVVRAELHLNQFDVEGSPYAKLGNVVVDHVDYIPDPGPDSYDGQNLSRNIGTLSVSPATGARVLDVTTAVRDDLAAGRPWSQFRLRFYSPVLPVIDLVNDYVRFVDGEALGGRERPSLVVEYQP